MPFDAVTQHFLNHQGRRMRNALHEQIPPNRALAREIQTTVDEILDRRPQPIAVAPDGEVLYDNASPWEVDQALSVVQNQTGRAERVLPRKELEAAARPTAAGGTMDLAHKDLIEKAVGDARKRLGLEGDDGDGMARA